MFLRAANDVKFPMCISILSMVIVRLGVGYLLAVGLGLGAVGVWCAMILDWGGSRDLLCGTVPEREVEELLSWCIISNGN